LQKKQQTVYYKPPIIIKQKLNRKGNNMTKTLSSQEVKTILISDFKEKCPAGKDSCNRVIKVINGYGKREGFFNKIGGIFYRIWNTVKAIFGQSDWQLASKSLQKNFLSKIKTPDNYKHLPKNLKKKRMTAQRESELAIINPILSSLVKGTYLKGQFKEEILSKFEQQINDAIQKKIKPFHQKIENVQKEIDQYFIDNPS
jgi:hypothetical protein